ncbi:MAG TPA: class I SAM-dependent methyltransferase [Pyrinomonadaceae bacterium]|nr:class I SAM-dependent methyltransferase [Pyrinomonadaceae bacterium]
MQPQIVNQPEAVHLDRTAAELIDPVCEFYTDHPYPPPVENLDRARDEWQDENRQRSEFHLFWPHKRYRADLDILIAGCGTWQAAKYALCRPAARVVGIDVSKTSLDHTERLKRQYELANLELEQTPIERAADLDQRFDLIVCTGVLHHLNDPDAGLRALRSALKPDGAIYLMVYAPYGRAGVYLLQDYCRRLGIGTSAHEIDNLATVVEALPPHHPLAILLRGSRDALNADALADALLNPRDQSFSVSKLFDFIERNDLEFGRWYWQAPYLPHCGSIAATPHAKLIAQLSEREQCAAMELWRGTMTCHSLVACRSGTSGNGASFSFAGNRWSSFVPLRLPNTMCVEQRLPAGAAGVLLNRSHPFHDLILVINAQEKRLLDRIDGRRSIAEIVNDAESGSFNPRDFFQKLWWYDQVVFDTSQS